MFYTIYKITNNLDGKYYIGKHQTKDLNDEYFGSGKLLKRAIKKHGIDNFTKEILHVFDTEAEMNAKEKELVVLEESSYNLCPGGKGGWGFINQQGLNTQGSQKGGYIGAENFWKKRQSNPEFDSLMKEKFSDALKERHKNSEMFIPDWTGRKHSEETKQKMRESRQKYLLSK